MYGRIMRNLFFELFGAASVFDFIIRWEGHFFGMLADTWAQGLVLVCSFVCELEAKKCDVP